ncbi:hypothetical protein [Xanthobacter pseudotagetidis]|uniref:hypothetical protein n=1 Tax=Xanthobacter pseudotagetidis TaxID=3119911 RepID=UPI003728A6BD
MTYAYWDGSLLREDTKEQRIGQILANLGFQGDKDGEQRSPMHRGAASPVTPPGGILIVALLSGVSGAIAGLVFGGYLTIAIAVFVSLTLGLAVGIWSHRTDN